MDPVLSVKDFKRLKKNEIQKWLAEHEVEFDRTSLKADLLSRGLEELERIHLSSYSPEGSAIYRKNMKSDRYIRPGEPLCVDIDNLTLSDEERELFPFDKFVLESPVSFTVIARHFCQVVRTTWKKKDLSTEIHQEFFKDAETARAMIVKYVDSMNQTPGYKLISKCVTRRRRKVSFSMVGLGKTACYSSGLPKVDRGVTRENIEYLMECHDRGKRKSDISMVGLIKKEKNRAKVYEIERNGKTIAIRFYPVDRTDDDIYTQFHQDKFIAPGNDTLYRLIDYKMIEQVHPEKTDLVDELSYTNKTVDLMERMTTESKAYDKFWDFIREKTKVGYQILKYR